MKLPKRIHARKVKNIWPIDVICCPICNAGKQKFSNLNMGTSALKDHTWKRSYTIHSLNNRYFTTYFHCKMCDSYHVRARRYDVEDNL